MEPQQSATISNPEPKLTPKQTVAIAALLTAKDIKAAAAAAGIGERTIHTWLEDPAFQTALHQAEARAIDTAVRRLVGAAGDALDTLQELMTSSYVKDAVRVRAATVILEQLTKLRELNSLEARLAALEALQPQGSTRRWG